jgi:hypothetical protein
MIKDTQGRHFAQRPSSRLQRWATSGYPVSPGIALANNNMIDSTRLTDN